MLKGLKQIQESIANRGQYSSEGGLPELDIRSGEVALVHFLTDHNDIVEVRFHRIPDTTQGGFSVMRERLCRQEVGETCSFCNHASEDIRRRTLRWYAWVFAYALLTPSPVPNVPQPEQIQRGSRMLNVWKLNAPAILRKGEGNNKYLVQQVLTHGERFGTLCDHVYEWERTGSTRNDTTYLLSALPEVVAKPDVKLTSSLEELISKEMPLSNFPVRQRQEKSAGVTTKPQTAEQRTSQLMSLLKGSTDKPRL